MEIEEILNGNSLTYKEGYEAMLYMLYNYWKLTDSDDLTDILSGGEYIALNTPADPLFWKYWLEAIEQVRKDGPPPLKELTPP